MTSLTESNPVEALVRDMRYALQPVRLAGQTSDMRRRSGGYRSLFK